MLNAYPIYIGFCFPMRESPRADEGGGGVKVKRIGDKLLTHDFPCTRKDTHSTFILSGRGGRSPQFW